nr:ribonuclease H-like domain-containing protein [Tanacetum cinerariifolium]
MAITEDHLAKFHKMTDAKEMWEAIKSRFSGNDESKKMQKYILKQQFKGFSISNSEGLHKGYDRFQSHLSQLEIHDACVSTEDARHKFLRVFEFYVKGSTTSSSSTQNVAFVSSDNPNSTNEVNEFDLEEMDLKWQVAMISIRLKKFYKKTGKKLHFDAKEPVGFNKSKVECFNCHNTRHFTRECKSKGNQDNRRRDAENTGYKARENGKRLAKQDEHKAMVTIDGEGVDWTGHVKDDTDDYALMAFNSSNSGSDTEVTFCLKICDESYAKLKKLYDEQKEKLGDASIEKTKPKNYLDDYLLNTPKIMFEKSNVEASVWKDQKGRYGLAKVKSWKLIESCGVYYITFLNTQMFLLVERMYPLTHFTLEQMLNDVRLY